MIPSGTKTTLAKPIDDNTVVLIDFIDRIFP